MEYDQYKVDEMVLALLSLTMFEEDQHGARAWKGHDWVAIDRLHEKDYISDPKEQAKSVVVTVQGVQRSRELFEKHFGKKNPTRVSGRLCGDSHREPFRSGKRVRARITARQAPFRKERGTPCGCASLRGVDRPRPRPVKALPLCSECLSLPQPGQPLQCAEQFPHEVPKLDPVPLSCWASMTESTPCRRA